VAGVADAFSGLGMSPNMVNEFVPVILEYTQSAGSEQAVQLLKGALSALKAPYLPCDVTGMASRGPCAQDRGVWAGRSPHPQNR
jgi:hypothetical protein